MKLFTADDMESAYREGEATGWTNANSVPERLIDFEQSRTSQLIKRKLAEAENCQASVH